MKSSRNSHTKKSHYCPPRAGSVVSGTPQRLPSGGRFRFCSAVVEWHDSWLITSRRRFESCPRNRTDKPVSVGNNPGSAGPAQHRRCTGLGRLVSYPGDCIYGATMDLKSAAAESTIAGIASKTTQTGAAVAVIGGLAANELAAYGGLAVAVSGLLMNWLYRHRADRRDAEKHALELERLRQE